MGGRTCLRNGFGAVQSGVKRRLAEEFELDKVESAGSLLPTTTQLSAIFPNRLEAPTSKLFYPIHPTPTCAATCSASSRRSRSGCGGPGAVASPLAASALLQRTGLAVRCQREQLDGAAATARGRRVAPPEPEAAGPLAAVPQAPRGYRLPAARRQPSWRGD